MVQPDLVDQVLFEEDYGTEVQRKRTTSVSKMDRKDSVVPEEEEDEERPQLPNGIPGQWTDFNLCVFVNQNVNSCILKIPTHVDRDCGSLHFFKKNFLLEICILGLWPSVILVLFIYYYSIYSYFELALF